MDYRTEQLETALRKTHGVLNDLMMLWIAVHGKDWNTVVSGFDALALNRTLLNDLPITASFADDVESRANPRID